MAENYGPYSNLKFIHHTDRIKSINGSIPAPVNVQLVISNACNLNCSFCYYRNGIFPPAQAGFRSVRDAIIPRDKIFELIQDCGDMGVKSITITGGGEPTVHPDCERIFSWIIGSGLELGLNTNGVNLTADTFKLIEYPQFQWVKLSLDAGTPETYSSIKSSSPDKFWKAYRNIRNFVEYKEYYKSNITIGVGFIIVPENYHEVLPLAEELKQIGVDSFRIRSVAGTALRDFYGDKVSVISDICKEAQKLSDGKFKVENLFVDDIKAIQHPRVCLYQYLHTFIGADMNVNACCLYSFGKGVKGSIANQSFKDFWYSDEHKNYLKNFNPMSCSTCDYLAKNELLEYIASPNPVNVNFI